MKVKIISLVISLLFVCGCSEDINPTKNDENNYDYELSFQFYTLANPNALVIDNKNGYIYIVNGNQSFLSDNHKIQKFSLDGELILTIVDFANDTSGLFTRYLPIDLTLDNDLNICVLVRPYHKNGNDDYWEPYQGFCIMIYNSNGEFQKELDYSKINLAFAPEAITFKNDLFYVTNSYSLFKISKSSEELSEIQLSKIINNSFPEFLISDLAVDGSENIWTVGQTTFDNTVISSYISKMDPKCNQLFTFNSVSNTGEFAAKISRPSIKTDENGIIYLTTFYCKSLEIYNSSGSLLGYFDIKSIINETALPIDLGIDSKKNIYVLDYMNDAVYVLTYKKT